MNRDPLWERGGLHLYAMCGNNSIGFADSLGKAAIDWGPGDGDIIPPNPNVENSPDPNDSDLPVRHHRRANIIVKFGRCEIHVLWGHYFKGRKVFGPTGIETVRLVTYEEEKFIIGDMWRLAALLAISFCFNFILGNTLAVRVETLDLLLQHGDLSTSIASTWIVENLSVPGTNGIIIKNLFLLIWLLMTLCFLILTITAESSTKLQLGVLFGFSVFNSISAIFGYILFVVTTFLFFPSHYIMGSSDSDITSLGTIIMWTNYLLIVAAGVLISYIVIRSARGHKRL